MQKHMNDFNQIYYLLEQDEPLTLEDAKSNLVYILTFEDFYTETCINLDGVKCGNEVLALNNEKLEEMIDLQRRILDGFKYDMCVLMDIVNENNFKEICKLANFLLERLKVNMWATEGKKKNMAMLENGLFPDGKAKRQYPEENSLFVEVFFVEKLKEVANVDVLALRK